MPIGRGGIDLGSMEIKEFFEIGFLLGLQREFRLEIHVSNMEPGSVSIRLMVDKLDLWGRP
jgi:hypothetical protein